MRTERAPKFLPFVERFSASRMPYSVYVEISGVTGFRPIFETSLHNSTRFSFMTISIRIFSCESTIGCLVRIGTQYADRTAHQMTDILHDHHVHFVGLQSRTRYFRQLMHDQGTASDPACCPQCIENRRIAAAQGVDTDDIAVSSHDLFDDGYQTKVVIAGLNGRQNHQGREALRKDTVKSKPPLDAVPGQKRTRDDEDLSLFSTKKPAH